MKNERRGYETLLFLATKLMWLEAVAHAVLPRTVRCRRMSSFSLTHLDLYSILGVDREATQDEIKGRYHALARIYHPDKLQKENNKVDVEWAALRFKSATGAYNVLRDPLLRKQYDCCRDLTAIGNTDRIRHWLRIHRPIEVLEAGPH